MEEIKELRIDLDYLVTTYGLSCLASARIEGDGDHTYLVIEGPRK